MCTQGMVPSLDIVKIIKYVIKKLIIIIIIKIEN